MICWHQHKIKDTNSIRGSKTQNFREKCPGDQNPLRNRLSCVVVKVREPQIIEVSDSTHVCSMQGLIFSSFFWDCSLACIISIQKATDTELLLANISRGTQWCQQGNTYLEKPKVSKKNSHQSLIFSTILAFVTHRRNQRN